MQSSGGLLRSENLNIIGQYHGQLLEYIVDNMSSPQLMYWNGVIKKWLPYGSGSGIDGGTFIADVRPQSSTENISNKIYVDDINVQLESFITTTSLVTVDILIITGHTHYKPNGLINGMMITNITPLADKPLFKATMNIDLDNSSMIRVEHEDGAFSEVSISYNQLPKISSVTFTGNYPITNGIQQTELKEYDVMSLNITTDKNIVKVEIADYGACKSQTFNVASSSDISLSNVLIANRGVTSQLLGTKLRVQSSDGGWSDWFSSDSLGNVENVNVVKLNNLYPSINISNIVYPTGQQALKDSEQATVINTCSNYDTISYSSSNGELGIINSSVFEGNKIVNRIAGGYNISNANFKISATRNSNGSTTTLSKVVNIANVDPVITVTEQYARLISAPTGNQSWIRLISNQKLIETPILTIPQGLWVSNFTTTDNLTYQRTISINDSLNKGTYSYTSMSAKNLAGKVVTVISGDNNYIIGGFATRRIVFPAFVGTMPIGCSVVDVTKLSVVDLSGNIYIYKNTLDNNLLSFTIVDPNGVLNQCGNYIKIIDQGVVNQNSTGTFWIDIGEGV
jgi:hypothetical protein